MKTSVPKIQLVIKYYRKMGALTYYYYVGKRASVDDALSDYYLIRHKMIDNHDIINCIASNARLLKEIKKYRVYTLQV